jgi:hypothetical protein
MFRDGECSVVQVTEDDWRASVHASVAAYLGFLAASAAGVPGAERGDLRVEVRAADDPGGVLPRRQIFRGDGVGDDVLLRDADELCELAPDRGTAEGVRSNVLLTGS